MYEDCEREYRMLVADEYDVPVPVVDIVFGATACFLEMDCKRHVK